MLKVECESCKATYQVDERRVPANGLKMRCPKCGNTFLVKAGSGEDAAASARKAPPIAPPAAKPVVKQTMFGLGVNVPEESDLPARPAAVLGAKGPPRPAPKAPPIAAKAPAPPVPAAKPAAIAPPLEVDPFADEPIPDLPSPARRDVAIGLQAKKTEDITSGLPPALGSLEDPRKRPQDDFPVAASALAARKPPAKTEFELDLSAGPISSRAATFHNDLPAISTGGASFDLDLPSAAPAKKPADALEADLPSPAGSGLVRPAMRPQPKADAFEMDLPSAAVNLASKPTPKNQQATFEIDLPSAASQLPSPAKQAPAVGKGQATLEIELPSAASQLPSPAKQAPAVGKGPTTFELDLPVAAGMLPVVASSLPSLGSSLPTAQKQKPVQDAFGELDLPSVSNDLPISSDVQLPTLGAALPMTASAFPMTANSLPMTANSLPMTANTLPMTANTLPARAQVAQLSDFGELDLPPSGEGRAPSKRPAPVDDLGFGELDLAPAGASKPPSAPFDDVPGAFALPPNMSAPTEADLFEAPTSERRPAAGGMAFGEVDLGGGAEAAIPMEAAQSRIGGEMSLPEELPPVSHAGAEAALPTTAQPKRVRPETKSSPWPRRVVLGVIAAALVIGTGLEATPYGAFGRNAVTDKLHAQDYATALTQTGNSVRARMGKDTFVEARGAADDALGAHGKTPRAKPLTAYAAFVEFAFETRFGADAERSSRAKQTLAELTQFPETQYLPLANAALEAANGNLTKARQGLETASRRDGGDPIQEEIALLRGELELHAKDAAAAKTAFAAALKQKPSARAHYGLARAAKLAGDEETMKSEVQATLAATPNHPGAIILRASQKYTDGDEAGAMVDYVLVADGAAKALSAPNEIADALTQKGFIDMKRGRAGDARVSFESALKLIGTHIEALVGQGMLLSSEGRTTEALSRFDTAIQNDPADTRAIAWDAITKVRLERLKEAKDQLVAARAQFPKSMLLAFALAEAERALGNRDAAEKALRESIDLAQAKDPDAMLPYIALANVLASEDKNDQARAIIADAGTKLPDTPALERALGEFLAGQGHYDDAVVRYRRATELDPADLATRFKLGVTYRRMRKMDDASAQFDQVLAVDKDYPGLSLERGLLYEESGDTEKALEQFKNALAKAPDDPDLMLRVGAAYVAIDRPDDALPMLRKVLEKRANSAEANHYLGRALFAKGGTSAAEATRYLKRATELDPNRAEYHLYVAWAANESNSREALGTASDEIDKAMNLDKLNGDIWWQRGVLERKQGRVEDAIKDLKRAIELKPTRIDAHATMAECLEDKNDAQGALGEWQRAVSGDDNKPTWRYRYGKLLLDRGSAADAVKHLAYAVTEAEKMEVHPGWYADVQFQAGEAYKRTGQRKEAVARFKRFLEIAPTSSPDRRDAIAALSDLGAPYGGQ